MSYLVICNGFNERSPHYKRKHSTSMATIINSPGKTDGSDNSAGWSVAVIILIAVIGVGAYLLFFYRGAPAPTPAGETNINVTVPGQESGAQNTTGGGGTGTPGTF